MAYSRKLIFISNDDGYTARGINYLAEWLRPLGDIIVVAPESGRSGAACSITASVSVTVRRIKEEPGLSVYACSGTPVDCVKLAFDHILPRRPGNEYMHSGIHIIHAPQGQKSLFINV